MTSYIFFVWLIGSVPCIFMLLASFIMMHVQVSDVIEATLQNFSAGLILAAVGNELFPLLSKCEGVQKALGITIGFVFGLILVYGIENYVETFNTDDKDKEGNQNHLTNVNVDESIDYYQQQHLVLTDWEEDSVTNATQSITIPAHQQKLKDLIYSIVNNVNKIEIKTNFLTNNDLSIQQVDDIGEEIDEEIHKLDYILDRTRRMFEGSRSKDMFSNTLIKLEKQQQIMKRLIDFKRIVKHIEEHIISNQFNEEIIKEIYEHLNDASLKLNEFHSSVQSGFTKWHRSRPFPLIEEGFTVPLSMLIPICIDGLVDGFLIGLTCTISFNAGVVLSFANSIEMSLLGAALSVRVAKCTASSLFVRLLAISLPPVFMFLGTIIGSLLGHLTSLNSMLFTAFVSFGIVALLYLVCHELLLEAYDLQNQTNRWQVSIALFAGVFLVLISGSILD